LYKTPNSGDWNNGQAYRVIPSPPTDAADGSSAEKAIQNIESFVGSKKQLPVPYELDAAQALQLHSDFKSRDGRVLTSRSEHHRELVA